MSEENVIIPRAQMWQTVIHAVTENIDSFHINPILSLINKTLTFDDPGLFSSTLITNSTEQLYESVGNIWLINQLIYSSSITSNKSVIQNSVSLQKEILSGSLLKQSWFFKELVQEYVDFTDNLLNISSVGSTPIELKVFFRENVHIAQLDPSATFRSIKISKIEMKHELLENCLNILTHAIAIGYDMCEEMFESSNQCISRALQEEPLNIKIYSIKYITKIISRADELTFDVIATAERVCQGIQQIVERIPLWLELEAIQKNQITEFNEESLKLLYHMCTFKCPLEEVNHFEKIIEILSKILTIIYSNQHKTVCELFKKFSLTVVEFITNSLKHIPIKASLIQTLEGLDCLVRSLPDVIRIFEVLISKNITELDVSINFCKSCKIWRNLYKLLTQTLEMNIDGMDSINLMINLKIILEILKCSNSIDQNYQIWHQSIHLQSPKCKVCNFVPPEDMNTFQNGLQIERISLSLMENSEYIASQVNKFFESILKMEKISAVNLFIIVEIAGTLLQNKICLNFKTDFQISLIDLITHSLCSKFSITRNIKNISIEDQFPEYEAKVQSRCFYLLVNIDAENISAETCCYLRALLEKLISNNKSQDYLRDGLFNLMINKILPFSTVRRYLITPFLAVKPIPLFLSENIKDLVCCLSGNVFVFKFSEENNVRYKILCRDCDKQAVCSCPDKEEQKEFYRNLFNEYKGIFMPIKTSSSMEQFKMEFAQIFTSFGDDVQPILIKSIPSLLRHLNLLNDEQIQDNCIQLFKHKNSEIRSMFSNQLSSIVKIILCKPPPQRDCILEKYIRALVQCARDCLNDTNKEIQSEIVNMILKFGSIEGIPEMIFLHLFKMTFLFFIRFESCVVHEAALCAAEICSAQNVTPRNMLNWYKQDILKLTLSLAVSIYLRNGVELNRSLNSVTKMLGYIGPCDFIVNHYQIMVAILLPWCIKYPKSKDLLEELGRITRKNMPTLLSSSFLTAYPYLFLNETTEINNKCIDFVIDNTASNLYNLLHSDIKKTVAEILIYYHKSPEQVMKVFRCLLPRDVVGTQGSGEIPHGKLAQYISTRFLGVLTYFEACLIDADFEKNLKRETLLSLGEIMRFIGSKHITPFRFKILTMLRTAMTISLSDVNDICAKVWNIFIHTVDVQVLGPLLSTIVTSLEPLLTTNAVDVNSMYKFLILTNGSLLSVHISDLYFIENFPIDDEIKEFVAKQTKKLKCEIFTEKFKFFLTQIDHENLVVRTYGLNYLTKLFASNRQNLNNLILGQNNVNPLLETVLDNLMVCCRHIDKNLQLSAGKCLGEIGAVEPSHLPPNYAPQRKFAIDIHTDTFAIMALEELCRAYQFQKDTKYVDSFSLAIQEILLERGVCPKQKKKMNVWEAIPERMRPLMEPLLTSCYTALSTGNVKVHPVFGSAKCQTYEEWAYTWATKLIGIVYDHETRDLLCSFKPSIRRDASVLALFLPYIVLHSLQSSDNEQIDKMYEELQCVFEAAVNKNWSHPEVNTSRPRGLKTLQFVPIARKPKVEEQTEQFVIKCAKVGFEQLDFLQHWLREWRVIFVGHTPDSDFIKIQEFLKRFDAKLLAKANFNCGEFARALMHLEAYIESEPNSRTQENLSFLAKIYAELMDPDSVDAAITLKKADMTLSEQILVNNMTNRTLESTACFEKLMQSEEVSPSNVRDIVQCYLRLDTPETALLISEGLLNRLGEKYMDDSLMEIQAEPMWRLERFDDLEKLMENPTIKESNHWGVHCGQALLSLRKNDSNFESLLENIRLNILTFLRSGGNVQNAYHKGYPQVIKLHLISEIEKTKLLIKKLGEISSDKDCVSILSNFLKQMNSRLNLLQPTPQIVEPVLCLQRHLLKETKEQLYRAGRSQRTIAAVNKILDDEIGSKWIRSSELMRNAGWFQQAQLCIMNAEQYEPENLFLEKAKLLWKKGDQTNGLKVIEQKINEIEEIIQRSDSMSSLPDSTRLLYAETKFLQASYNAESMNISSELNIRLFKESLAGNQKSEKCLVHLAQYLDKIYASSSEQEQQNNVGREMLLETMVCYGKSMFFGCEFIYQSMPRMLSIWFDFTAQLKRDEHFRKVSQKMNDIIEKFSESLPLFIFLTAFSQLVSRICHPSTEVYHVLKTVVVRLIQKFPQQSLWMLLSIYKSSYPNRRKRCTEIFTDRRLNQPEMQKLIGDFDSLAEKLIELTNKEIPPGEKKPTVSSLVRGLPNLFKNQSFSKIVMPFQQFMQPILPPIDDRCSPVNSFNTFPNRFVYIHGIKDEVTILLSLQKPRKVALVGSDGKQYFVMMKPKDDLRKDFRLMEFNAVVKQYLHQDPEARQRRLGIRTYAVLPLNEECGLIEWVHNLYAFRQILLGFYKHQNQAMNAKELRATACGTRDSIEKKRDVYLNKLLPRHPPVFADWFKQRFTTPHNWYQARSSYIRTTAVMSIVGYILGLGDRHGENILFDGTNGDAVHVDFNCLFNKGETFDYPEKVPFRLTHNMIHAMGPLGVEGLYRKCCEITMRVLQTQAPTLMSVVRPFVYDPLVSWNRHNNKSEGISERTDPLAMENVKHIEERLKGFVKIKGKTSKMPLSTEGQVNHIILEATNIDNLAAMYIGWGAFM